MPLWPTVSAYFTHPYYQHLGQVSTLKGHLFAVNSCPDPNCYLTETLKVPHKAFDGSLLSCTKHSLSLTKRMWVPTVPVFLKWYLLSLKIKAQVDKDKQSSTKMTPVEKQNCNDRVGQRKKQLVGLSSCSFKSAGC